MQIQKTVSARQYQSAPTQKFNENRQTEGGKPAATGRSGLDRIEISASAQELYQSRLEEAGGAKDALNPQGSKGQQNGAEGAQQHAKLNAAQAAREYKMNENEGKNLDLIRQRIEDNYYQSSHVFTKIAEGLLRDMNITGEEGQP